MVSTDKKREKRAIQNINKNLSGINSYCKAIVQKHNNPLSMSERDYIYLLFSADILYKIKDIIFLNKKLNEAKNNFDSSLYVLSRSVLEPFFYLKYLLCEDDKITLRMKAFICHSSGSDIKMLNSIKLLAAKKKFIFDQNDKNILSSEKMIDKKISEWEKDIITLKNFQKDSISVIEKEINILKNVEMVAKECDKILSINVVTEGSESKSLEWMYNYLYRFQCMPTHQNLRDKEKVFELYNENKKEPNNFAFLNLMEELSSQTLKLYTQ